MEQVTDKWEESVVEDGRLDGKSGVVLRLLSDVVMPPRIFADNLYFVGLNVMRCYSGRFRFSFNDRPSFGLKAGELVVIYPEHYVTIEALGESNRLMYCIFDGADVEDFFDDLGFFDCARGATVPRARGFFELRCRIADPANRSPEGRRVSLRLLTDMLVSQLRDLRTCGNGLLYEAVRLIHANLKDGVVRLEPLCAQLKISRSYLHGLFVAAGLPSPSEIIRREQLRAAVRLLREGILPIPDVMEKAGFISQSHFSTFVKRLTGHTPSEIRRGTAGLR